MNHSQDKTTHELTCDLLLGAKLVLGIPGSVPKPEYLERLWDAVTAFEETFVRGGKL